MSTTDLDSVFRGAKMRAEEYREKVPDSVDLQSMLLVEFEAMLRTWREKGVQVKM